MTIAMILWHLNEPNCRIGKAGDQALEPVGMHDVIGVEHADDRRLGGGVRHGEPQCGGLEALEILHANELKALPQFSAASLDRLPQRQIRRIVDNDYTFEIGVIEPRYRIEGG